jgi:hypothetical protein
MSRRKLYEARIEICLLPEQKKALEKIAIKRKIRVNELLREIINNAL